MIAASPSEGETMPRGAIRPSGASVVDTPYDRSWPKKANLIRFALLATGFLAALLSLLIALPPTQDAAEATIVCHKYAATSGSDGAGGTSSAPYRGAQKLVDSLSSGQVGCLRGGVYTEPDKQVVFNDGGKEGDRIILRSYPGETAEFRGSIHIPKGSDYVTVRNMRLDGSYGPVGRGHFKGDRNTKQAVKVMGDNVFVRNNDITNRRPNGNPDLAGTCIILGSSKIIAANTSIEGNRIHHCGQMPRINLEHGIYASHPRSAQISDNFIYDNTARAIQLYPDADNTLVANNIIDGNGEGVSFSGSGDQVSSYNEIRNNIIANSRVRWLVEENYARTDLRGSGNTVHHNCVWPTNRDGYYNQNGGVVPDPDGFDAYNNVVANPGSSRCRSVL
jgi:Right handed beta helix region